MVSWMGREKSIAKIILLKMTDEGDRNVDFSYEAC